MRGSRDIALNHLIKSWEEVMNFISKSEANTYGKEYDYYKTIFEKSWRYIESCDRKYDAETQKELIDELYD